MKFQALLILLFLSRLIAFSQQPIWVKPLPEAVVGIDANDNGEQFVAISKSKTYFISRLQDSIIGIHNFSDNLKTLSNNTTGVMCDSKGDYATPILTGLVHPKYFLINKANLTDSLVYDTTLQRNFGRSIEKNAYPNYHSKTLNTLYCSFNSDYGRYQFLYGATYKFRFDTVHVQKNDSAIIISNDSVSTYIARYVDIKHDQGGISSEIKDNLYILSSNIRYNLPSNVYIPVDVMKDTNYVLTTTGVYDFKSNEVCRKTPSGIRYSDRYIIYYNTSNQQFKLWDIQNSKDTLALGVLHSLPSVFRIVKSKDLLYALHGDTISVFKVPAMDSPLLTTVRFTCDQNSATLNSVVTFTNFTFPRQGCKYLWDFGDGKTDTNKHVKHAYSFSGLFKVTLRVITPKKDTIYNTEECFIDIKKPQYLLWNAQPSIYRVNKIEIHENENTIEVLGFKPTFYRLSSIDGKVLTQDSLARYYSASSFCSYQSKKIFFFGLNTSYSWQQTVFRTRWYYREYALIKTTQMLDSIGFPLGYTSYLNTWKDNSDKLSFLQFDDNQIRCKKSIDNNWIIFTKYFDATIGYTRTNLKGEVSSEQTNFTCGNIYRYNILNNDWNYKSQDSLFNESYAKQKFVYDSTTRAVVNLDINPNSNEYALSQNQDMVLKRIPSFVSFHDISTGKERLRFVDSTNAVLYLNSSELLTRSGIYNVGSGNLIRALSIDNSWQYELLKNKYFIAVLGTSSKKPLGIFNVLENKYEYWYDSIESKPTFMCVSEDKNRIALGTEKGFVYLYQLPEFTLNGFEETNSASDVVTVYPVPADDYLTISTYDEGICRVLNLIGNTIYNDENKSAIHYFNTSSLSNGVYIIVTESKGKVKYQKVMIQH
ncbi:MAG: PKD domain-containing protein [Candidatus Kapaibacterium sp.]